MFARSRLRLLSVPLGVALLAAWGEVGATDSNRARQEAGSRTEASVGPDSHVITDSMLINAGKNPGNWILYGKDYQPTRYNQINEIDPDTIKKLELKWVWSADALDSRGSQTITFNEDLFVNSAKGQFFRVDGRTGRTVWKYDHPLPGETRSICCDVINLDPVLYKDKLYVATLDGHLLALDSGSGEVVWEQIVAANEDSDSSILASLAVVDDKVIVVYWRKGTGGVITARDTETGKEVWSFPAEGQLQDVWKYGGASIWVENEAPGTIYWGVGQPNSWDWASREDNNLLHINPTLGLNPDTGDITFPLQYRKVSGKWYASDFGNALPAPSDRQIWFHNAPDGHLYSVVDDKLQAINAADGKVAWMYDANPVPLNGSVMATGGGIVFAGDANGHIRAFVANKGEQVWSFYTGASHIYDINALQVDGQEMITVLARNDSRNDDYIMAFQLP